MSFKAFPSIGQLSDFISSFKNVYQDDERNIGIEFSGTIKMHGSNAAVGFSDTNGLWVQSRTRIITPEADNYDFAKHVYQRKEAFEALLKNIASFFKIDLENDHIVVFGEWCGEKIQNRVAISALPRMFVLFDVASKEKWYDISSQPELRDESIKVYNIGQFQKFKINFSLNTVSAVKAELIRMTEEVEKECPVGKYFGINKDSGVCSTGEGIVWRCEVNGNVFRFKVKGDEHATSKVKKLCATETDISPDLAVFIEATVTENRLEQGISEIFAGEPLSKSSFKRIGEFNSWIVKDIKKEDMDAFPYLSEYKGEKGEKERKRVEKELNKAINEKSKAWFQRKVFMME